ncbi:MAG: AbrB/MazE/SpoVT family DNA-binding domain-containing protein [Firmicutes bacterium]|nr:AbrB/MazE/SpoVT family DNA-binding domain-containing protein [Bacillota bacterium]
MKSTGIVRRIDELGRIVIPMEYRKMHKINIGDPMEILASDKGEITLRKIGLESEYIHNASVVIESMVGGLTILACDGLRWRVGRGPHKEKYLDNVIDQKAATCCATNKAILDTNELGQNVYLCPVVGLDSYGALLVISDKPITDVEINTVNMLASITTKLTERV